MPSATHNSTMKRATDLIFALFNVALCLDVPFCQLQLQRRHHGLTVALLCVLCLSPLSRRLTEVLLLLFFIVITV